MLNAYFLNYKGIINEERQFHPLLMSPFLLPQTKCLLAILSLTLRVWNQFLSVIPRTGSEFSIDIQKGLFQSCEPRNPCLSPPQTWPKRQRRDVLGPPYSWPPFQLAVKTLGKVSKHFAFRRGHLRVLFSAVGQGGKKPPLLKIPELCLCLSEPPVLTGRAFHHGPEGI